MIKTYYEVSGDVKYRGENVSVLQQPLVFSLKGNDQGAMNFCEFNVSEDGQMATFEVEADFGSIGAAYEYIDAITVGIAKKGYQVMSNNLTMGDAEWDDNSVAEEWSDNDLSDGDETFFDDSSEED